MFHNKLSMADQKLVSYVKTSLERGVPLSRIRSDLYNKGWPKKDTEDAIASASSAPKAPAAPAGAYTESNPKSGRKMYIGIIAVILVGIGIVTYITVFMFWQNAPPVQPRCGDSVCDSGETYETCPSDCQAPPANSTMKISVTPKTSTISRGGNVDIGIQISSASNLYGFQFDIKYNPAILNYSRMAEGIFLNKNKADGTFCVPIQPKSSAGKSYVTVACTRLGPVGGVSGDGLLESVTFTSIGSGTSELAISNLKFVDTNVKEIAVESEGGSVTVQG
jgi:hypothetical protein